jgi:hypothetical protein
MTKNKKKKRDSVAEVPRGVDAALIYASVIEGTVNKIMFTPLAIRDLMDVLIGEALISRCPEKTDQCYDKGFCQEKACPYAFDIHTPVFIELLEHFNAGLSRFLAKFVRNLKEQIPGLVEAAIVESEIAMIMGNLYKQTSPFVDYSIVGAEIAKFVANLKEQIPGLVDSAIVGAEIAEFVRNLKEQIPGLVDSYIVEAEIAMIVRRMNKQIPPIGDSSIVDIAILESKIAMAVSKMNEQIPGLVESEIAMSKTSG